MFERLLVADDLRQDIAPLVNCIPKERVGVKEIILCHAVETPRDLHVDKSYFEEVEEKLRQRASSIETDGIKCKYELAMGRPGQSILELAEKYDVSMIITGSQHRGGVRGAMIGSVSYSILHETIRPTMVVRLNEDLKRSVDSGQGCYSNILFPTDFSETSEDAFLILERLSTLGHSKVTLFHVHDQARIDPYLRHMLPEFDRVDKSRLERLKEHLESNGAGPCTIQISYGIPAQRILRLANSGEYQLIIMGCQGRGYIPEIFLGSTANAVARHVEIPVIFCPHRQPGIAW